MPDSLPPSTTAQERSFAPGVDPNVNATDASRADIDFADIERRIDDASAVVGEITGKPTNDSTTRPFQLDSLTQPTTPQPAQPIDVLGEVELDLRIELGRTQMTLQEVLQLRGGSVVALNELIGDPANVYVNGRIIARGEIVVMNDNFCVRVTELVGS